MSRTDLNMVALMGNLTEAPQLRRTASNFPVTTLRLASTARRKDKTTNSWVDKTNYIDVDVWGTDAENACKYLDKGSRVSVKGEIEYQEWTSNGPDGQPVKRSKIGVRAESVGYEGTPKNRSAPAEAPAAAPQASEPAGMPPQQQPQHQAAPPQQQPSAQPQYAQPTAQQAAPPAYQQPGPAPLPAAMQPAPLGQEPVGMAPAPAAAPAYGQPTYQQPAQPQQHQQPPAYPAPAAVPQPQPVAHQQLAPVQQRPSMPTAAPATGPAGQDDIPF